MVDLFVFSAPPATLTGCDVTLRFLGSCKAAHRLSRCFHLGVLSFSRRRTRARRARRNAHPSQIGRPASPANAVSNNWQRSAAAPRRAAPRHADEQCTVELKKRASAAVGRLLFLLASLREAAATNKRWGEHKQAAGSQARVASLRIRPRRAAPRFRNPLCFSAPSRRLVSFSPGTFA